MAAASSYLNSNYRIGVLGAGQLGKMLGLAAANWHLPLHFLDSAASFPAGLIAGSFTPGDFNDYATVLEFGRRLDLLTIEIEHVNTAALAELAATGTTVHPDPLVLELIKDKGRQKMFYQERGFPTAPFALFPTAAAARAAITQGDWPLPVVQKSRLAGYDGKGVQILRTPADLEHLLEGPCLLERLAPIAKELAVVVARNAQGSTVAYPVVEMDFNPHANLVEMLLCPARVDPAVAQEATALALDLINAFPLCGLLAVEFFWLESGALWINEVAPRPHNSGHHTIDSCYTSQFEQHLRAILNLPLGATTLTAPAVMVNLLGAPGSSGQAVYQGWADCLALPGVKLHLYGKTETKPLRKMGHATVVAPTLSAAIDRARLVQEQLQIVGREG